MQSSETKFSKYIASLSEGLSLFPHHNHKSKMKISITNFLAFVSERFLSLIIKQKQKEATKEMKTVLPKRKDRERKK